MRPRTLFEKVWDDHVVAEEPGAPTVLYIDLHLVHEVTSPQAFTELRRRGLPVKRPQRTVATMDHSIPTDGRPPTDGEAARQLASLEESCRAAGIPLHGMGSDTQGIVHVIGPELGLTQPGMTVVCGDSHTSTHGAFGALAFGIGTTEVGHVLATQTLLARKPRTLEVRVEGALGPGVSAKDLALAIVARLGAGGGSGHVLEYTGATVRGLDMEGRMTVCNMSIEAGARAGLVAPDELTERWLAGRSGAQSGAAWDQAIARWRRLPSDPGAAYDRTVTLDGAALEPMITYGTNPAMAGPVGAIVPEPADDGARKALAYMGVRGGAPLTGRPIDVVFVGSCTNGRLSDLRAAARVLAGRKVAGRVRMLVVPGSMAVKRQAEAEGLDRVFRDAGAEWREPGCSMCIAMNADRLTPGQVSVSTSNRNFEGRQGPGGRTHLASPLTAAACAVAGAIVDPREML